MVLGDPQVRALEIDAAGLEDLAVDEELRGPRGAGPGGERVMAELLLLAGDAGDTGELAIGLSQAFVGPDGSGPGVAREKRASAFADLYRNLTLHQLNSQVRNKAAAILGRLHGR